MWAYYWLDSNKTIKTELSMCNFTCMHTHARTHALVGNVNRINLCCGPCHNTSAHAKSLGLEAKIEKALSTA